ncbi:interferon phi 2 [Corythoichthys intestinalis]|uniref:interferon phi 2 n=1 Tax=Corythoichthys intestinalis TaxID=161448 RepID=UPI0025A5636E|nr:interferon phi 2 [Corythoichthys intestinalis]
MNVAVALLLIVLYCSGAMTAVVPACEIPGDVVEETHILLRDLGAPFPARCLPYNANVTFPRAALANETQCRRALRNLRRTLQGSEKVFEDNEAPQGDGEVAWNPRKLEDFQNLQNRVVQEAECLSSAGARSYPEFSSYFGNVSALVQQQESTACGWSMLRRDVLWVLKNSLQKHHSCFRW